ncbi:MAG: hypothetical protein RL213_2208 [Bacteroidota bacterium]|jgi:hypothetical protein
MIFVIPEDTLAETRFLLVKGREHTTKKPSVLTAISVDSGFSGEVVRKDLIFRRFLRQAKPVSTSGIPIVKKWLFGAYRWSKMPDNRYQRSR